MAKKKKWYVVWIGANPGIYDSWSEASAQVRGYPQSRYRAFESLVEAQEAFRSGVTKYLGDKKSYTTTGSRSKSEIIIPSLSVDAACSGNPGIMEYRGVSTKDAKEIFRMGPFEEGTNNIGEFLALVHGLAYLKKIEKEYVPIYTDSKTAVAWVRNKKVKTTLARTDRNKSLWELIERGEKWIRENSYETKIYKWDTKSWGEIPADFGRK